MDRLTNDGPLHRTINAKKEESIISSRFYNLWKNKTNRNKASQTIQIPSLRNGQTYGQKSNNKHFSIIATVTFNSADCNAILFEIL